MAKRSKKPKLGNCYEAHALALLGGDETGLLCHGTVWHPEVGWHGHCWIEVVEPLPFNQEMKLEWCVDISNGHNIRLPLAAYYYFGKVKDVRKYTVDDARALILSKRTYGPWK